MLPPNCKRKSPDWEFLNYHDRAEAVLQVSEMAGYVAWDAVFEASQ